MGLDSLRPVLDVEARQNEGLRSLETSEALLSPLHCPSPTFKSSKLFNIPPIIVKTYKHSSELESRDVSPTSISKCRSLPVISRSLNSISGRTASTWLPYTQVPLPPHLCFDSWWNEQNQRINVAIDYNTSTNICTASVHISVAATVSPSHGQLSVDPWDLHVGAKLRLLGKKITLRKARDQQTLSWLDQQALMLLRDKARMEAEMSKYRQVANDATYDRLAARCEGLDLHSHMNAPAGGRMNLRSLRDEVLRLAAMVRQHQRVLPPIRTTHSQVLEGPADWAIEVVQEEQEVTQRQKQAKPKRPSFTSARADLGLPKKDFFEYLTSIPLAASAARLTKQGTKFVDTVPVVEEEDNHVPHGKNAKVHAAKPTGPADPKRGSLSLNMDALKQRQSQQLQPTKSDASAKLSASPSPSPTPSHRLASDTAQAAATSVSEEVAGTLRAEDHGADELLGASSLPAAESALATPRVDHGLGDEEGPAGGAGDVGGVAGGEVADVAPEVSGEGAEAEGGQQGEEGAAEQAEREEQEQEQEGDAGEEGQGQQAAGGEVDMDGEGAEEAEPGVHEAGDAHADGGDEAQDFEDAGGRQAPDGEEPSDAADAADADVDAGAEADTAEPDEDHVGAAAAEAGDAADADGAGADVDADDADADDAADADPDATEEGGANGNEGAGYSGEAFDEDMDTSP